MRSDFSYTEQVDAISYVLHIQEDVFCSQSAHCRSSFWSRCVQTFPLKTVALLGVFGNQNNPETGSFVTVTSMPPDQQRPFFEHSTYDST